MGSPDRQGGLPDAARTIQHDERRPPTQTVVGWEERIAYLGDFLVPADEVRDLGRQLMRHRRPRHFRTWTTATDGEFVPVEDRLMEALQWLAGFGAELVVEPLPG